MLTIVGAIALCVIAYMIIGMFWYSPFLFGSKWAAITKKGPENTDKERMNLLYGLSALGALLTAVVLNYIMSEVDIINLQQSLFLGCMLWLGFAFPQTLSNNLFQGKPKLLTIIDSGYSLASILAMSTILYFFMFG